MTPLLSSRIFAPCALAAAVLVAGCASSPDEGAPPPMEEFRAESQGRSTVGLEDVRIWRGDVSVSMTLEAPADEVGAVLPAVYRALEIPVARHDPGRRIVANPAWQPRRIVGERPDRHFRCGSGNSLTSHAASYAYVISVRTSVRALEDGRSQLVTRARATARPRNVSGGEVSCTSRQRLEKAINGAVIGALGQGEGSDHGG